MNIEGNTKNGSLSLNGKETLLVIFFFYHLLIQRHQNNIFFLLSQYKDIIYCVSMNEERKKIIYKLESISFKEII
jgi:hypothetical protein